MFCPYHEPGGTDISIKLMNTEIYIQLGLVWHQKISGTIFIVKGKQYVFGLLYLS